jgi:hypothetical protein
MDLTLLPSKKTVAKWELGVLVIAQGNSVIELTPEQAAAVYKFIGTTMKHAVVLEGERQDLGK